MPTSEPLMMEIGVIGRIASGAEQGRFVFVQDDTVNTGGFLILTAADRALSIEASDSWVESREALERYMEESKWVIEWEEK